MGPIQTQARKLRKDSPNRLQHITSSKDESMKMSVVAAASAAALLGSAAPTLAYADVAFGVGATTDYRYRSISQSRLKPAVQGGVEYSQGGFYLGAWGSFIIKGEINKALTCDVGLLAYVYAGNKVGALSPFFKNADTTEIYGALTHGPATLKYSHAISNLFGNPDSENSCYLDLSATIDVQGFAITPQVGGRQKIDGPYDVATCTDHSLTVAKELAEGFTVSLALIGTDADKAWYASHRPANS